MMTDQVNVTPLNFEDIKTSLKNYMKNQDQFKDYNFEGDVMNILLDVLSYNTYHNSYYLNMVANESFLDTASIKENVVSHAKKLDYTPKSNKAAYAVLNVQIYPDDSPEIIVIPKGSNFSSIYNNKNYNFTTIEDYYVTPDSAGNYIIDIIIYEGYLINYNYTNTGNETFFEILDSKVDTDHIKVNIKNDANSTNYTTFSLAENITEITATSEVYFLQMNYDNNYEIYFGNNVIGKSLNVGNIVNIESLICNGSESNDISTFTKKTFIPYNKYNLSKTYNNVIFSVTTSAANGQDSESIDSIKFSAPKKYDIQNRIVTVEDYKKWLSINYNDFDSISVWGGEDHDPPIFGKTIISIKPTNSYNLSTVRKTEIINRISEKCVLSIDPIIIDPVYTFINISSSVYYNSLTTTLSPSNIVSEISDTILSFENNYLGKFNNSFYLSKLITSIDNTDSSISYNSTTFNIEKRLTPILNTNITYKIKISESLYNPYTGYIGCLNSSGFKLNNQGDYFVYLDDDGNGNIRLYRFLNNKKLYLNNSIGIIDYTNGVVYLNSFNFKTIENDETFIRLFMIIDGTSYSPLQNEILLLSDPAIKLVNTNTNSYEKITKITSQGSLLNILDNSIFNTVVG